MSTTNPDSGHPPVSGLTHTPPGSPRADNHGAAGPPDPSVIARGHEVDSYDAVSVMSVPLLVVLFFALAFTTVTILFYFIAPSTVDPNAHPQAVERNEADINTRLARIHRGGEVDQPRLEPLKLRDGESRAITRPALPTGNSPELHPENLRPSEKNTPELYRGGWADANKTVGRLSIDDAMDVAVKANLLPAAKSPSTPIGSTNKPTASNAGRGFGSSRAAPPAAPAPEAKKEEGKKDEPKKEEGKKEEPKKKEEGKK